MTAKEMFKELGYEKIEDEREINYIKTNKDLFTKQYIIFDKELKKIRFVKLVFNKRNGWLECRDDFETKDFKIFLAIQQQIKELGW